MPTLTISSAKRQLGGLVDNIANEHRGYCIVGKKGQAVLISMEDWTAIEETLYLNSVPGMTESILEGMATPVSECSTELAW